VRIIFGPSDFFSVQSLPCPWCFCVQFCPAVATIFCSSCEECPTTLWTAPAFSKPATKTHEDLTHPVAAAAITQVKLCPYDEEEEPHMWFRLVEAQFTAAGIRSQKLKYANALASLPKHVLRDILDTLDVCNNSEEPFDHLKKLCSSSLERANGNPILSFYASPWKCRASSPAFS
jgi:hypothetical protein